MNIYEAQMYVNLVAAARTYADGLNDEALEALQRMVKVRHAGNGYWSWDGLLDDLIDLTGDEDVAAKILNNC